MVKKRFAIIGAGFIGKSVIRNLLSKDIDVSILDRHVCPDEFVEHVRWISGSFYDQSALSQALQGVSVAYHFVSTTVPGDQHTDVAMELNENVVGALHFVDACLAAGVKRIVFASSASVYGLQDSLPINELAPTNPISAHGIHKLMVEKFLLLAHHLHGIEVRILRIANPYGPGQSLVGRQGFIAMVIGHHLRNIPLMLRDDGRPIRDFIYIDDLAEASVQAGLRDGLPFVINIATGHGYSLRDVISVIEKLTDKHVVIVPTESRIVDIPISVLDVKLAHSAMSFSASTCLYEGLFKTLLYHGFQVGPDPLKKIDS
ncbi:MAG: NAD-dependent epimerase/dehydratase family protein [Chlorobium sp.]